MCKFKQLRTKSINRMPEKQDSACILAIESSCDDTAIAIIKDSKILANVVSSQSIHKKYGGVIPELAGRAHLQYIVPVFNEAMELSKISKSEINAIAYTQGPGLIGSLIVGAQFAKGLSMGLNIPTITVNHLQAHVSALFLAEKKPDFPLLCLLVSGGHTQIILVKSVSDMEIIGSTIDDAAGEAFDKTAKMLNLPYPGGPLIDQMAETGNPKVFAFPISKLPDYQYSFSGLKTSCLYFLKRNIKENPQFIEENINDIAASMRFTIVKTLLQTFERAVIQYKIKDIGIAGGVSANKLLRKEFENLAKKHGINAHVPAFEYCTDNAAMIAIAGHYKYLANDFASLNEKPFAR